MSAPFFTPYIGSNYQDGFLGNKTLVVGAHHYCPFECQYKTECMVNSQPFDRCCPAFVKNIEKFGEEYKDYYTLSNDNEVEIDSYIDGAPYPAYSAFTKYMLGIPDYLTREQKKEFWDSVAFHQYTQHYLPDGFTPSYQDEKELFDEDYPVFADTINKLQPEVVFVWNPAVCDCILDHEEKSDTPLLIYEGKTEMQALSLFVFVGREFSSRNIEKKGVLSAKHINVVVEETEYEWFAEQVEMIVGADIALITSKKHESHRAIKRLSEILFLAYKEGLAKPCARGCVEKPEKYNGDKYYAKSWAYFKKLLHELFKGNCNSALPTGEQYEKLLCDNGVNKSAPQKPEKPIDYSIRDFFEQFQ